MTARSVCTSGDVMAIARRIRPKYKSRTEEIVARIRAEVRADPPIDPHKRIKKKTAELAYLLALAHGGDWRVEIDLQVGFVLVSRRTPE